LALGFWLLAIGCWLVGALRHHAASSEVWQYLVHLATSGKWPVASSQQPVSSGQQPAHTTMFTMRLGTTITFLGALPSSLACTSALARTAASTSSLLSAIGNSSIMRVLPLKLMG